MGPLDRRKAGFYVQNEVFSISATAIQECLENKPVLVDLGTSPDKHTAAAVRVNQNRTAKLSYIIIVI